MNLVYKKTLRFIAACLISALIFQTPAFAFYMPANEMNPRLSSYVSYGEVPMKVDRRQPQTARNRYDQQRFTNPSHALGQPKIALQAHYLPNAAYYSEFIRPHMYYNQANSTNTLNKREEKVHTSSNQSTKYTIQAGDTLYRIARFFETTVDLLMMENGIDDPTKLKVGQEIKIPIVNTNTDWLDENSEIVKTFQATLTAYTAGFESTGKTPSHPEYGITSSGAKVKENYTIAVDPNVIPMGSLVYIDGIGIRKAQDTGSAIKGNKIDVYIPDLDEALKFGVKKNVKVYVLNSNQKDVRIASSNP